MHLRSAGESEGTVYQGAAKVKANLYRSGAMREYEDVDKSAPDSSELTTGELGTAAYLELRPEVASRDRVGPVEGRGKGYLELVPGARYPAVISEAGGPDAVLRYR